MNAIRDGNQIRVYDAYLFKESIKEIDGRFYDKDDRSWVVPFSKENAEDNSPENLLVMPDRQHRQLHMALAMEKMESGDIDGK